MIYAENDSIKALIMHRIGNKSLDEGYTISDRCIDADSYLTMLLTKYFISPFISSEFYYLFHETSIELNEIYNYVSKIFNDFSQFHEQSINIAKHLYNESIHPKIKAGELYVVYFQNCIMDGKYVDAIGVFKSENKDTFFKIIQTDGGFGIATENGININKLDKGCLIFNIEEENGYVVAIVDNTNKGSEAKYWTDDFLHVKPRKDSFNQTRNMLSLCKSFVSQLPSDNGKIEKATYMNRSVEALKEESVNVNTFAENVFKDPGLVSEFKQYKDAYQKERDIEIDETFETAYTAIKRRATGTMTTIKLDKNFDINIHGGEQNIVRGYDEERGMHYYKLFFKEEK
jgi:hypothetical protein